MIKTELLLPAGNLEKLKYALLFGADACYIGAKEYSLRAQASNFTLDDIKEGVIFAHSLNKKVYVTVNVIPREREIDGVKAYLKKLESINVDGIIVSSPAILNIAKENTNLHVSISTQESISNSKAVNFFKEYGIERVVLARELSIQEIKEIKNNTDLELEVFIHGGMCSAYSGRCTLSNYLSNRDANRGGCAHSCRWNYDIYKNGHKLNNETFQIASKDLCALSYIKELVEMGIDSLKIEGRMKSIHYIATIAYSYRKLIDDIENGTLKDESFYKSLLEASENREYSSGFFSGNNNSELNLYSLVSLEANQSFIGNVLSYDKIKGEALIESRNYFDEGDEVEVMSPNKDLFRFKLTDIYDSTHFKISGSRHALDKIYIKVPCELKEYDILRKVSK